MTTSKQVKSVAAVFSIVSRCPFAMEAVTEVVNVTESSVVDAGHARRLGSSRAMTQRPTTGATVLQSTPSREPTDRGAVEKDVAQQSRLMDLNSAAAYLGVSYWTVREWVFNGVLPSVKLPKPRTKDGQVLRRILIDRPDLDKFIDANKETEHF
jgi:excisionase family DNA binding protein